MRYRKPFDLIELMRLIVYDLTWFDADFEIQTYPMRLTAIFLNTMHFSISERFDAERFRVEFFLDFFPDGLLKCIAKLHTPSANIPPPVLVTAIHTSLIQEYVSTPIMEKAADSYTWIINSFFHKEIS